jgi:lysophospholipase L1-like esterase
MDEEQVKQRTIPLVKNIRNTHPETPIILVENFIYSPTALDTNLNAYLRKKNEALKQEYDKLKAAGYNHLHYISGKETKGVNLEGTVDGTHFTDLGFMQYADLLIHKFSEFGLITDIDE